MWDLKEAEYILHREIKKLSKIIPSLTFKNEFCKEFILAYWEDCIYFYNKKDYVKSFELVNYIWGFLDALAILKLIDIPTKYKKNFKGID